MAKREVSLKAASVALAKAGAEAQAAVMKATSHFTLDQTQTQTQNSWAQAELIHCKAQADIQKRAACGAAADD